MSEPESTDDKEKRNSIHFNIKLGEEKVDPAKLESIKKSLSNNQELSEDDKQYLAKHDTQYFTEHAVQLQKVIVPRRIADQTADLVQRSQEKENKKNITFDKTESQEKEKKWFKINKKPLKQSSPQLRQVAEPEKIKWTLDLISKLKETKIGDADKLDHIGKLLKSGKNIEESDRRYLKETAVRYKIVDCKTKVTKTHDAIKKLQEIEIRHSTKMEKITNAIESGKLISKREQRYLNARYEKLQAAIDKQRRIEWTISIIQKLEEFQVGNFEKLDEIKEFLEDDIPVPENDVKYLREEYGLLRQMLKYKKKIESMEMVNES